MARPDRDGRVAWLPDKLPATLEPVWEQPLSTRGLGGVAATTEFVIVSDRTVMDTLDAFVCLNAADGKQVWAHRYPALGQLDFGNSPAPHR